MKLHTVSKSRLCNTFTSVLVLLLMISLTSCFDSSTEEAPPSLRETPAPAKPKPTAIDDTLSVPLDSQGIVNVVDNDTGPGGVLITIDSFDQTSANGGTVVNNGDGTFTYTPVTGYEGQDTFSYTIKDPDGNSDVGIVTITISTTVIPNGKSFYSSNCAICHAAGIDDITTAFNGSDLSLDLNPLTKDLTVYGGSYQLMGAFYDVPQKNIDEVKAYLATL